MGVEREGVPRTGMVRWPWNNGPTVPFRRSYRGWKAWKKKQKSLLPEHLVELLNRRPRPPWTLMAPVKKLAGKLAGE